VLLDRGGNIMQQRIAGAMTMTVIDLLQPVDIDVSENQLPVAVTRAVDLTLEQQQPDLATERTGELIQLRASQIISPQPVITVRAGAILDRRLAISGGVRAVSRAFAAVDGPLIGRRLVDVAVRHGLISVSGSALAVHGRLHAIRSPLLSRHLRLITIDGIIVAVIRGALAVIGRVRTVRGSPVGLDRRGVRRARVIVARWAVLERLALDRRLVDVASRCVCVTIRGGVLAAISRFATPARAAIGCRLGAVALRRQLVTIRGGVLAAISGSPT
jgi:hypothetical protein